MQPAALVASNDTANIKLRLQICEKDLKAEEGRVQSERRNNRDLSRRLYDMTQLGMKVASYFGLESLEEAAALVDEEEQNWAGLCEQLAEYKTDSAGYYAERQKLMAMLQTAEAEVQRLKAIQAPRSPLATTIVSGKENNRTIVHFPSSENTPKNDTAAGSTIVRLQSELLELQRRFDYLLDRKHKVTAIYSQDFVKWREYKQGVDQYKKNVASRGNGQSKRFKGHDKRPDFDELGIGIHTPDYMEDPLDIPFGRSITPSRPHIYTNKNGVSPMSLSNALSQLPIRDKVPLGSLNLKPLQPITSSTINNRKRKRSEVEAEVLVPASSQTETDESLSSPSKPLISEVPPIEPSTSSLSMDQKRLAPLFASRSISISKKKKMKSDKARIQSENGTRGFGSLRVGSEPHSPYDLEFPRLEGTSDLLKPSRADRDEKRPEPSTSADVTINSRFKINPDMNDGLDHQFDAVVRKHDARKKLHAGDCECCRDYYQAVGPLPKRLNRPVWRSPSTSPSKGSSRHDSQPETSTRQQEEIERHRQQISRHRHNWERARTPPGYWNIGFPTTQEASQINHRAREMHAQKMGQVEAEASRPGGRYKRR